MCSYSVVVKDWAHPSWPMLPLPPAIPPTPNAIPWTTIQTDPSLARQMLVVLEKLEAIDRRLGTLEKCIVSEPQKAALKDELRKIADQL